MANINKNFTFVFTMLSVHNISYVNHKKISPLSYFSQWKAKYLNRLDSTTYLNQPTSLGAWMVLTTYRKGGRLSQTSILIGQEAQLDGSCPTITYDQTNSNALIGGYFIMTNRPPLIYTVCTCKKEMNKKLIFPYFRHNQSIRAGIQSYVLSIIVNIKKPINASKSINTCTLCVGMSQTHIQLPPLRPLCSALHGLLSRPAWGPTWTLFLLPTHSSIPNSPLNTLSCDMSQTHIQLSPLRPLCSAFHGLLSRPAWGPTWTLFLILAHSSTRTLCQKLSARNAQSWHGRWVSGD